MDKDKKIKVCIVTYSLGHGGAERCVALLSQLLVELNFKVSIVSIIDDVMYAYSGELLNLGTFKKENESKFHTLKPIKIFRNYIKKNHFDVIIDHRTKVSVIKEMIYMYYIYRKNRLIYVVHNYNTDAYFTKQKWFSKWMINRVEKFIGVSKLISEKVNAFYHTNKAVTIYNPIELFDISIKNNWSDENYILFLGRFLEKHKNISLLLEAYKLSDIKSQLPLYIVGDGPDKDIILSKIKELQLEDNVRLFPFTDNVQPIIKNAKFLALSSRYEGFPRVLIEALSVGTPVVSVDCKSGPSEIVINEQNGLLVENNNPQTLANAFNRMGSDVSLYQKCKNNAVSSVSHLSFQKISEQWKTLLDDFSI